MTKTAKEILIIAVEAGKHAGFTAESLSYHGKDGGFSKQKDCHYDTRDAVDQALKELEAIMQGVIGHEHSNWCFIHCPYKSVEGVQITEEQTKKLLAALYGKED